MGQVIRLCLVSVLLGAASLAAPAAAAGPVVTVSLSPDHGLPGTTVHVTVRIDGCAPTAVKVSFVGGSARGDETGQRIADAAASATSSGAWEADVTVPEETSSHVPAEVAAVVTCPESSPPPGGYRGKQDFRVDGYTTQKITVSPDPVTAGRRLSFVQTGGRGSCWIAGLTDAAGKRWSLWNTGGNPTDPVIRTTTDMSAAPKRITGSFPVPANAAAGRASLSIHCSQTNDHAAVFQVVRATPSSPAAETTTAPAAETPTAPAAVASPTGTATPLPTPSATPSASPVAVGTRTSSSGPALGWGALLLVLALVAGYGVTRRVRPRRPSS